MTTAHIIVLVSALLLTVLVALFYFESQKNRRLILARVRGKADISLVRFETRALHWSKHMGSGSLRIALHFILHTVLGGILYVVNHVQEKLHNLRQKNKNVAKAVIGERDESSHLSAIAKHKETVALTEEQKEELRNRSLHEQ